MSKLPLPPARSIARAALAGLAVLALSACAGGGTPAAGDATAEATTAERATIRLLLGPVFYEPAVIAQEQGLFEAANLDVEFVEGGTAAEAIPQLLNGQVDIAMTGGVSLITAVAEGIPLKGVVGATSADPDVRTSGLVVGGGSTIAGYGDLSGKTIGLQGLKETTHLATMLAAEAQGVDPASINFVQIPLPNINSAVADGTVDAGYPIGIFWAQGVESGLTPVGSPTSDATPHGPNVLYAATDQYIAENGDALERFTAAIEEATALGQENDFAMIRDVQLERSTLPEDFIRTAVLSPYYTDLYKSGFQNTIDAMHRFGWIATAPTIDDVIAPQAPTAS